MKQVYLAIAITFATIGLQALKQKRTKHSCWFITQGSSGFIGGEFIEE